MIKLRFTRNNNFTSKFIRWFTFSDWSHVEFEIPEGYLGALAADVHSDGRTFHAGVQVRPFDYNPTCEFQKAHVSVSPDVEKKIIDFAKSQIGKPYDWTFIIGLGIRRDWHSHDHWACSELFEASFDEAGDPLIRDKFDRVTPGMVYDCEQVILNEAQKP